MQALIIAFAMYSKIPMPRADWSEKNQKNAFCFFPLVGLVIGLVEMLAWRTLHLLNMPLCFDGAVLTALPLLLTGGIHMDGFCDTVDARGSWADREKKLQILKDPHVGSFAVIFCGLYLVAQAGAWGAAGRQTALMMLFYFPLERAASALCALNFPVAGSGSSLEGFRVKPQEGRRSRSVILILEAAACLAAMAYLWPAGAAAAAAVTLLIAAWYHRMAMKQFGGTRGDMAGWFLQCAEISALFVFVILERVAALA